MFVMDEMVLGFGLKGVDVVVVRGFVVFIYFVLGDFVEWYWFIGENERE